MKLPDPEATNGLAIAITDTICKSGDDNPLSAMAALLAVVKEVGGVIRDASPPQYVLDGLAALTRDVAQYIQSGNEFPSDLTELERSWDRETN